MLVFVASIFVALGFISILMGVLGIYRFPDALTRIHASSLIDNMGMILMLVGIAMLQQNHVNSIKVIFMIIMIFLLSPVSSHALAKAVHICTRKKSDDGI